MKKATKSIAIFLLLLPFAGLAWAQDETAVEGVPLESQDICKVCVLEANSDFSPKSLDWEPVKAIDVVPTPAELDDKALGQVRGTALTSATPGLPNLSAAAIILWDETGARGGDKLHIRGVNVNAVAVSTIRGR